jgi:hypothetical protein
MSKQLTISSALSVFLMAAFVVFGPHVSRIAPGGEGSSGLPGIEVSAVLPR